MNSFQKYCAAILIVLFAVAASPAFAEDKAAAAAKKAPTNEVVERGWTKRCLEQPKGSTAPKNCEVFQRADIKESGLRLAEFAIGFPEEKDKKDAVRGVVALPLGILLENGISMKIDDGKPVMFKSRYCTAAGCFSYISVDKALIASMKKGKNIVFQFKTSEGQDVNLIMGLQGFDKAYVK